MFPTDVLAKFHKMPLDDAIVKARQYAVLMDGIEAEAEVAYRKAREAFDKAEAARLVKERQGVLSKLITGTQMMPIAHDESIVEYIRSGGPLTLDVVESEEDGPMLVLTTKAHLAANAIVVKASSASRTGGKTQNAYFHNGERIQGPLSKFIEANYPDSRAWALLVETREKERRGESKGKLGAWQAVLRDEVLRPLFTQQALS